MFNEEEFMKSVENGGKRGCVYNVDREVWESCRDVDANDLIVCNNRMLNFTTGETYIKTLNLFCRTPMPVNYDINLGEPVVWDEFLKRNFENQEQIDEVLKQLAFLVLPCYVVEKLDFKEQAFLSWIGKTGSGKGVVIRRMKKILGNHNWIESSMKSLGDIFGLQNASGMLACFLSDTDKFSTNRNESGLAIERIKKISGDDSIDIRMPGGKIYQNRKLRMKIVYAGVEMPYFSDSTAEMSRRARVLVFKKQYSWDKDRYPNSLNPDLNVEKLMDDEMHSFFTHRIIRVGMKKLLAEGLKPTVEGKELIDEVQEEGDIFKEFWQLCTVENVTERILSTKLLEVFKQFCVYKSVPRWKYEEVSYATLARKIRRDDDIVTKKKLDNGRNETWIVDREWSSFVKEMRESIQNDGQF